MQLLKRILLKPMKSLAKKGLRAFWFFPGNLLFEYKLRRAAPLFIYQMGKVGSSSVYYSLRKVYPGVVLHGHNFFPNDQDLRIRRLHRYTFSEKGSLNIISLTREPVGRNISAFFQNFERDTGVPYKKANFSLEELRSLFLSNFGEHEAPLQWFDNNIRDKFGIDVYAEPFPECGFSLYSLRKIRLLVMRSEIDDKVKIDAIKDFLGLVEFQLINKNIGSEKKYKETYREFKSKVKLPPDYIAKMCESKYFKHFYSQAVIEAVKSKWSDG